MNAAHANDAHTIGRVLEHPNEPHYYRKLFRIGNLTAINSVVLPLILHRISIHQRRTLLSIENNRGISALKLAALPTNLVRAIIPESMGELRLLLPVQWIRRGSRKR